MKLKIILLCVLFFLCTMIQLKAQENIVKANLLLGSYGVQYERALSDRFSVAAGGGLGIIQVETTSDDITSLGNETGYAINAEARYYLSANKDLMEGWHIGPHFYFLKVGENSVKNTLTVIGGATGYQWIFGSGITLDFSLGAGYADFKSDDDSSGILYDDDNINVFPIIGIAVGYNF